jgi:hypothetical protein
MPAVRAITHPVRHFQLADRIAQFVAIFAFDATRDAAPRGLFGISTR